MPPPPSSSVPRGRSAPAHGSAAHGSAAGFGAALSVVAGTTGSVLAGVALLLGVVCGCFLVHAGAPSIAPANTTVRQIVLVVSRFMASPPDTDRITGLRVTASQTESPA